MNLIPFFLIPHSSILILMQTSASHSRKHDPDFNLFHALTLDRRSGLPSSRMVLLKGFDAEYGFKIFTNLSSRKGVELVSSTVMNSIILDASSGRLSLSCTDSP